MHFTLGNFSEILNRQVKTENKVKKSFRSKKPHHMLKMMHSNGKLPMFVKEIQLFKANVICKILF